MSKPERDYVDCDGCGGTGGPDPVWDDELRTWHHYVCGSCSGSGGRWVWREDDGR